MDLSILLITYNQEKYIRESLDSILMQDMPVSYEIVVADDHSTDNTPAIIKEVFNRSNTDYRMLESIKNLGIDKNYQRGFAACKGKYIAVMEGDDYWTDPLRLKKHMAFLEAHRECVLSFNRLILFRQDLGVFSVHHWESSEDFQYFRSNDVAGGYFIGNMSATVIRSSIIQKIKDDFYDLGIGADWGLGIALGQYGLLGKLKETMSVHRVHKEGFWNSSSFKQKQTRLINRIDAYNKYFNYHFDKEFMQFKRKLRMRKLGVPGFLFNPVFRLLSFKDAVFGQRR